MLKWEYVCTVCIVRLSPLPVSIDQSFSLIFWDDPFFYCSSRQCFPWYRWPSAPSSPWWSSTFSSTAESRNALREYTCTLQRNMDLFIPRQGTARPPSKFPHSCVCERSIYFLFLKKLKRNSSEHLPLPEPSFFSLVSTFKWLKIKYKNHSMYVQKPALLNFSRIFLVTFLSNETLKSCQKGCFRRWKMHLSNFTTFGDVVQCFSRKTLIYFQHLLRGEISIDIFSQKKLLSFRFLFSELFYFINLPRKTIFENITKVVGIIIFWKRWFLGKIKKSALRWNKRFQ